MLRYGFRPFFLSAGIWAIVGIAVRVADIAGYDSGGFAFRDPTLWHAHAMLFGYTSAVVAGFTLTAVPNWTGRLPISGMPLLALFSLWLAGRVALFMPFLPTGLAAAIDASFLPVLAAALAREILAGRNFRNIPVCALVLLLGAANTIFHLEALGVLEGSGIGTRAGVGMLTLLIGLIGGRIVPSFTNNWLARQRQERAAKSDVRLDRVVHGVSGLSIAAWIFAPFSPVTAGLFVLAAAAHAFRLARWKGWRTARDPLVLVLHVGYAWLPVGFLILGYAIAIDPALASGGLHALTAGAIGTMTLAVMTRATLGHTGRELRASPGTSALYAAITVSAALRVAAGFLPDHSQALLSAAGGFWLLAFLSFAAIYGPMQLRPRLGSAA